MFNRNERDAVYIQINALGEFLRKDEKLSFERF